MIKNIFFILFITISSTCLFAQSFYGKVESCSGETLEKIKIEILSNSPVRPRPIIDSILFGDNNRVKVELDNPAFYLVRFNVIKHESIEVPLFFDSKENIELNIRLKSKNNILQNIDCKPNINFIDDTTITAFTYNLLNQDEPKIEEIINNLSETDSIRRALAEWTIIKLSKETNLERSNKLLKIFPPTSNIWSIDPTTYKTAISIFDKSEQMDHLQEILNSHKDETIKPFLYLILFSIAIELNQTEIINKYYSKFESNFSKDIYYNMISTQFSPKRKIQKNNKIPEFKFISIDDSSNFVTNISMKNKIYLIDFWASWCPPCIAEMETLHEIYDEFNSKGFEIISVSLDRKLEDAKRFRKKRWPMPWFNAYMEFRPDSKIVKDFELASVPKPILVDRNGEIIAAGNELLSGNLTKTINKVFYTK